MFPGLEGWFVDDIEVSHARMAGTCTTDPDVLLADGFDDGAM